MNFAVRGDATPAFVSRITAAIMEADPRLSLTTRTLSEQVDETIRLPRTLGMISGFFGTVALLLASIGLYGIMSYIVARRRKEIGVRVALGAEQSRIIRMVLGDVSRMVVAGAVLGVALSFAALRLVSSFLYGVGAGDPRTLAFSAMTLGAVAVGAALVPAWRASRVDPAAVLRVD